MLKRQRYGALFTAAIMAGTTSMARAGDDPVQVVVQVENYAGVPARTLEVARAEVEAVFRSAAVNVHWREEGHANRRRTDGEVPAHVTLLVVDLQTAGGNPGTSMLGLAVRPRQNAFVFYNRILDVTRQRAVDGGVLLGRVMAHEIGHLLLPPGKHNHYGVMRGDIDVDATHPNRFTRDEADRIRQTLTQPSTQQPGDLPIPRGAPPADRPKPRV
jgi:hypothetical protein